MAMNSPLLAKSEPLHLLLLENLPIFQQLQLEEALLRTDERNWCLINKGSTPSIVMGISGKAELLIEPEKMLEKPVPLIRRFSGGGTVFVDSQTVFVTWICNAIHTEVSCCPAKIHSWIEQQYQRAYPSVPLQLKENDYVIQDRKCGGNAQYLCKKRWLHHSSFLWDYDSENMGYLKFPLKTPLYRQKRSHEEFLCRLKSFFHNKESFYTQTLDHLRSQFNLIKVLPNEAWKLLDRPHRKTTCFYN
jgi:lipoate---protein ligase